MISKVSSLLCGKKGRQFISSQQFFFFFRQSSLALARYQAVAELICENTVQVWSWTMWVKENINRAKLCWQNIMSNSSCKVLSSLSVKIGYRFHCLQEGCWSIEGCLSMCRPRFDSCKNGTPSVLWQKKLFCGEKVFFFILVGLMVSLITNFGIRVKTRKEAFWETFNWCHSRNSYFKHSGLFKHITRIGL